MDNNIVDVAGVSAADVGDIIIVAVIVADLVEDVIYWCYYCYWFGVLLPFLICLLTVLFPNSVEWIIVDVITYWYIGKEK